MADSNSNIVSIKIQAYDKPVVYRNLVVSQPVCAHHEFSFIWNAGDFKSDINFQLDVVRNFMGSAISISFNGNEFNGIITEITVDDRNGNTQSFLIKGQSPTILIDDVPRSASYNEGLAGIVNKTLANLPSNALSKSVEPVTSGSIGFTCQYNETDFQFLTRLAMRYGEWFYYDGTDLVFGKTGDSKAKLKSGSDLDRIVVQANLQHSKFNYKSYDSQTGEPISKNLASLNKDIKNDFSNSATKSSLSTYSISDDRAMHTFNAVNKGQLDALTKIEENGINARMLTIKGEGKNPALKAGCRFNVESQGGTYDYIATTVIHYSNVLGHYQNSFTAVPATVKASPYTNPHVFRRAEAQMAVVKENHDPNGIGRIQVQLAWQAGITPWIRVASPHGGGGKGMHFIPEKGEEVIVDFEGGDVDNPFAIGTVYSGKATTTYANADNDLKVIQTRSGHVIELNDKSGAESITVKDKNKNIITIDTPGSKITLMDKNSNKVVIDSAGDSIDVTSKSSINLNSTTINLLASGAITMTAGGAITMNAGGAIEGAAGGVLTFGSGLSSSFMSAMDTVILAGKMLSAAGGKNVKVSSGVGANIELEAKGDVTLKSSKKINITSKESTITGTDKATLKSNKTTVEGSSKAIVKGGAVDIS